MYKPRVANSDNTILRKSGFVKMSVTWIVPPFEAWATFSIPLKASRNAATWEDKRELLLLEADQRKGN